MTEERIVDRNHRSTVVSNEVVVVAERTCHVAHLDCGHKTRKRDTAYVVGTLFTCHACTHKSARRG